MSAACAVPECETTVSARGYCMTHYCQLRRTGSPYKRSDPRRDPATIPDRAPVKRRPAYATAEEKFWALVYKTGGCWLWTGSIRDDGAPMFTFGGTSIAAHRFSWNLHHPADQLNRMYVLQWSCPHQCVNPDHLERVYIGDLHRKTWARRKAALAPAHQEDTA